MVPELALAAETAQLDHRQHEIESITLGVERDLPVEVEARPVLRRSGGDQPAVAADWDEDTDFHALLSCDGMVQLTGKQNSDRSRASLAITPRAPSV